MIGDENTTTNDLDIVSMEWDPNENNLLVALSDGTINLVVYNGFDSSTAVTMTFDRLNVGVNGILWKDDKSGNFLTYSKKVGAIREWNVA